MYVSEPSSSSSIVLRLCNHHSLERRCCSTDNRCLSRLKLTSELIGLDGMNTCSPQSHVFLLSSFLKREHKSHSCVINIRQTGRAAAASALLTSCKDREFVKRDQSHIHAQHITAWAKTRQEFLGDPPIPFLQF